ncbi:MAG: serine protease [Alistipes sp.]|nr:serine protease [Alistipes sp.]
MGLIAILLILGAFFLVAELVFLPGVTLGAILSLVSYGAAIYLGFDRLGFLGGIITIGIALVLALIVTVISLRAKTWRRLALNNKVEGKSNDLPDQKVKIGDTGIAVSRLSPMGKVEIRGEMYEAKSIDKYIDQRTLIEVVGFENFTIIVKAV